MTEARVIELAPKRAERLQATRPAGAVAYAWHTYQELGLISHLRPGSVKDYRSYMTRAVAELPPHPKARDIDAWLRAKRRSPSTLNKFRGVLCAVTREAYLATHDDELRDLHEEVLRVKLRKLEARPSRCPTDKGVAMLLALAQRDRDVVMLTALRLAAFAALRVGELVALRPEHFTEDHKRRLRVHVLRNQPDRGPEEARKNARNGKKHVVTLDPETAECVRRLLRDCATRAVEGPRSAYLLGWTRDDADAAWDRMMERCPELEREGFTRGDREAGVVGNRWHALRHFAGTKAASRTGGSVLKVQMLLGDSTVTAAQGYIDFACGTSGDVGDVIAEGWQGYGAPHEGAPLQERLPLGGGEP